MKKNYLKPKMETFNFNLHNMLEGFSNTNEDGDPDDWGGAKERYGVDEPIDDQDNDLFGQSRSSSGSGTSGKKGWGSLW